MKRLISNIEEAEALVNKLREITDGIDNEHDDIDADCSGELDAIQGMLDNARDRAEEATS